MKNQNTPKPVSHRTTKQSFQLESHKFAHYQPQPILSMSALTNDGKLIAVARANASIEIWLRDSWS